MSLGLYIFAVYTLGSMLSLIREDNLKAIIPLGLPFMAEALIILVTVIPEADTQSTLVVVCAAEVESDFRESLLPNERPKIQVYVKSNGMFGLLEWWFYEAMDKRFMPEFCNGSLKQGMFSQSPSTHFTKQILTVIFILFELYAGIMSTISTSISPVISILVSIYSLLSLICYLDIPCSKLAKMAQSYFASFKLSAFCLGYLFDGFATKQAFEFSYTLMTIVITADAYLSYYSLVEKHDFSSSSGPVDSTLLTSNWKHGLFYNQEGTATSKTIAAFLLTL